MNTHVRSSIYCLPFPHYGQLYQILIFFQAQSGIVLSMSNKTVTFLNGEPYKSVDIDIQGPGFLEVGSTFSVSLRDVQYLGPGGLHFYL